jgi:hypothetical protein
MVGNGRGGRMDDMLGDELSDASGVFKETNVAIG